MCDAVWDEVCYLVVPPVQVDHERDACTSPLKEEPFPSGTLALSRVLCYVPGVRGLQEHHQHLVEEGEAAKGREANLMDQEVVLGGDIQVEEGVKKSDTIL